MDLGLSSIVSSAVSQKLISDSEIESENPPTPGTSVQGECGSVADVNDLGDSCKCEPCECDTCECEEDELDEDELDEDDLAEEDDEDDDEEEDEDESEYEEDREFISNKVEYVDDEECEGEVEVDESLILPEVEGRRYPSRKRKAPERYVHPDEEAVMKKFCEKSGVSEEQFYEIMTESLTDEEEEVSSYSIEGDYEEEEDEEEEEEEYDDDEQ